MDIKSNKNKFIIGLENGSQMYPKRYYICKCLKKTFIVQFLKL